MASAASVPLQALAPDIRMAPIVAVRRRPNPVETSGFRIELDEPWRSAAGPAYLVLTDRALTLRVRSASGQVTTDLLANSAATAALPALCPDLVALVVALTMWDDLFRAAGLWSNHVYLASDDDVAALMTVAGTSLRAAQVSAALDDLQAAHLLYRFPVARKFSARYTTQSQSRLNGWGRRLATRLLQEAGIDDATAASRKRLHEHVDAHLPEYADHLGALAQGRTSDGWAVAQTLPVGVLT